MNSIDGFLLNVSIELAIIQDVKTNMISSVHVESFKTMGTLNDINKRVLQSSVTN